MAVIVLRADSLSGGIISSRMRQCPLNAVLADGSTIGNQQRTNERKPRPMLHGAQQISILRAALGLSDPIGATVATCNIQRVLGENPSQFWAPKYC